MALQPSRLNAFRLNNSRLNYLIVPPAFTAVYLWVNGAWVPMGAKARVQGFSITQALNEVPDTATIRFSGSVGQPLKGQQILVQQNNPYGDPTMFAGHILAVRTVYEGRAVNVAYECDCIDYTFTLTFKKVTKRYVNQPGWQILTDLVSSFGPPGFNVYVYPEVVGTIDEITFTNEDLAQAISRVCERLGVYWFVRSDKYVMVFSSASFVSARTVTDTAARWLVYTQIAQREDLSPVATVIQGRGGGSTAAQDAIPGQTSLPVLDAAWYAVGGGVAESGPQRFTYAAVHGADGGGATTGAIGPPKSDYNAPPPYTNDLTWGPGGAGTGSFQSGNYYLAATNVTLEGETLLGVPIQVPFANNNCNLMVGIYTNDARPPDLEPKIKGFRVYMGTRNGGPETMKMIDYKAYLGQSAIGFNWFETNPGAYYLIQSSSTTTTIPPPTANTAGYATQSIPAGASQIPVDELTPFPTSGWVIVPGGQIVRYTGKSAATGSGFLTGVPASGPGAITAPFKGGTVKIVAALDGIPASGADCIKYDIKTGDDVYICVERSDATAIANLQAWIGYGDGKRYEFLTDGRLGLTELTRRCDALLAYRKNPLITVTFETRDPAIAVGRTITFNLTSPPIVGTFLIQRVQISEAPAAAHVKPVPALRQVEASSRRFTFDDLVQQMKLVGRIN